jgi:hypothetical protein
LQTTGSWGWPVEAEEAKVVYLGVDFLKGSTICVEGNLDYQQLPPALKALLKDDPLGREIFSQVGDAGGLIEQIYPSSIITSTLRLNKSDFTVDLVSKLSSQYAFDQLLASTQKNFKKQHHTMTGAPALQ